MPGVKDVLEHAGLRTKISTILGSLHSHEPRLFYAITLSLLRKMCSISAPLGESRLSKPMRVGTVEFKQRIAFLPLSRYCSDDDLMPLPFMQKCYSNRGSSPGTLVVSAATSIAQIEEGQRIIPSFVSDAKPNHDARSSPLSTPRVHSFPADMGFRPRSSA